MGSYDITQIDFAAMDSTAEQLRAAEAIGQTELIELREQQQDQAILMNWAKVRKRPPRDLSDIEREARQRIIAGDVEQICGLIHESQVAEIRARRRAAHIGTRAMKLIIRGEALRDTGKLAQAERALQPAEQLLQQLVAAKNDERAAQFMGAQLVHELSELQQSPHASYRDE